MENLVETETINQIVQEKTTVKATKVTPVDDTEEENVVINTQESTVTAVEIASQDEEPDRNQESLPEMKVQEAKMDENKKMQPKEDQQVRRQSERLGKSIHLTTQERNEIMTKKRYLEGNSTHYVSFSSLN